MIVLFAMLAWQSWREIRLQTGIRRIEMQFLVLNVTIAALLCSGLGYGKRYWKMEALMWLGIAFIIGVYAIAGWAITYYRIYDMRQVVGTLMQRSGIVVILAVAVICVERAFSATLPASIAYIVSLSLCSAVVFWLDRHSRTWLGIDGERILERMRTDVIELARTEPQPEKLSAKFDAFLCAECRTSFATLLVDQGDSYVSDRLEVVKERLGLVGLSASGWATPESLMRRRPSETLVDLREFMNERSLGLMVAAPKGSTSPALLMALGIKANEWPFTYPEVLRLQNVAELMDTILTRSRLSMQAALQAKMEHLAMMSRGLAHDLSNLITPISSFLVYTDERFARWSPEYEVHAAAQHSVRVMTEYVQEALFFSKELTPRYEVIELGRILCDVVALTVTRAAGRGVSVRTSLEYYGKVTADAVLLQRLLVNLVGNAIDASNRGQTVTLSGAPGRSGWLCFRVADEGCGIAPRNLERVFDPYFTTKSYGDDVRGFGLGLTICQKIVHLLEGTITVSSQPGRGTTMTVDLPLAQGAVVPL